jgi:hypothetical protein
MELWNESLLYLDEMKEEIKKRSSYLMKQTISKIYVYLYLIAVWLRRICRTFYFYSLFYFYEN